MSKIKSYSVGEGDMFYIKHAGDNFSIIDCCLQSSNEEKKLSIIDDINSASSTKGCLRFI